MKPELIGLSQRYMAALRNHLKQGRQADLTSASRLGCRAVALGVGVLDMARIHERAFARLKASGGNRRIANRAPQFFSEVLSIIVRTHRAARRSQTDLARLNTMLNRRTAQLECTRLRLQHGIVRRKCMEAALRKCGVDYGSVLKESLQLQKKFRQLTHRVLAAQEDERKMISIELQDEIVQTLLGINLRLLSLKREARVNSKGLKKRITSAQQLLANSARSARRIARKIMTR